MGRVMASLGRPGSKVTWRLEGRLPPPPFPEDLVLTPAFRRPTTLVPSTVSWLEGAGWPTQRALPDVVVLCDEGSADAAPPAGMANRVLYVSARAGTSHANRVQALALLRREQALETALLDVRAPTWAGAATEVGRRWGWAALGANGAPGSYTLASIVVLTYNNLQFTQMCLSSVLAATEYPEYEVIVVDNGSSDGTPEQLVELASVHPNVRVVLNDSNLGFAAGNNRGLAAARGDVLVLLNNDTIVARGWLTRLIRHLADPDVGAVGPVTNRTGNEAQILSSYDGYGEFESFAAGRLWEREGEVSDITTLTMFCIAFRRDTVDRVGLLDERFGVGLLEDDDYSQRIRQAGLRVLCADDVFVHHFGEASFGRFFATGEYSRILKQNQRRFQQKWGSPWLPYGRRPMAEYDALVERIRKTVEGAIPDGASVAVVTRGDERLLRLGRRRAMHFPHDDRGRYVGHHPADSVEAIAYLEAARVRGAQFVLFPATARWWLEYYVELASHLKTIGELVHSEEETCLIYSM
jgi:GT2 family glycosyltransferase